MVDFARETPIDVRGVCQRMRVCPLTVRRWMKQGLEWAKIGGKVYTSTEALNRFARHGDAAKQKATSTTVIDREIRDLFRELKEEFGINIGPEARTDGRSKKVTA